MGRESNKKALNARQMAFIDQFMLSLNATEAARAAGYSEKSARTIASDLLGKPEVQEEIARRRREQEIDLGVKKEKVIAELGMLAFSDVMDFCEVKAVVPKGRPDKGATGEDAEDLPDDQVERIVRLKALDQLPRGLRKAIKRIDSRATSHGFHTSIHMHDKIKALELLGRHFGLFDGDGANKENDRDSAKADVQAILEAAEEAAKEGEE